MTAFLFLLATTFRMMMTVMGVTTHILSTTQRIRAVDAGCAHGRNCLLGVHGTGRLEHGFGGWLRPAQDLVLHLDGWSHDDSVVLHGREFRIQHGIFVVIGQSAAVVVDANVNFFGVLDVGSMECILDASLVDKRVVGCGAVLVEVDDVLQPLRGPEIVLAVPARMPPNAGSAHDFYEDVLAFHAVFCLVTVPALVRAHRSASRFRLVIALKRAAQSDSILDDVVVLESNFGIQRIGHLLEVLEDRERVTIQRTAGPHGVLHPRVQLRSLPRERGHHRQILGLQFLDDRDGIMQPQQDGGDGNIVAGSIVRQMRLVGLAVVWIGLVNAILVAAHAHGVGNDQRGGAHHLRMARLGDVRAIATLRHQEVRRIDLGGRLGLVAVAVACIMVPVRLRVDRVGRPVLERELAERVLHVEHLVRHRSGLGARPVAKVAQAMQVPADIGIGLVQRGRHFDLELGALVLGEEGADALRRSGQHQQRYLRCHRHRS
mmetsp:Transcript_15683/g.43980  ORF Transcript_15683/g.43980 Transcript_15683/m.43980 type:complete len:488 (+) Transcript_15683:255-1718(+)